MNPTSPTTQQPAPSRAPTQSELDDPRTLLAIERTFYTWIRTGLSGSAVGFGLDKLIPFHTFEHQLAAQIAGQLLVLWGAGIFVYSLVRYSRSRKAIHLENETRSPYWPFVLVTVALVAASVLIFWLLLL